MNQHKTIRILLVDDHFVVRIGLASSLNMESDMEVVADAGNSEDAVRLWRELRPDVVVMDYELPDGSGVDAIEAILGDDAEARVLIFSVYEGEEDIYRAMEAGAKGYLVKTAEREELLAAIRTIDSGDEYLPETLKAVLATRRERPSLSPRQLEVLNLIVSGASNKEIARELKIAEVTVKLHITQLLQKLGVEDRTQAAMAAIQRGILHPG